MRFKYYLFVLSIIVWILIFPGVFTALAGPPFVTDDPEPVELRHWEFYIASVYNNNAYGTTGTAPHFEVNYGVAPETQIHMIAPVAYTDLTGDKVRYGLGDVELGVKRRFVRETSFCPQIGVFPLIELASGDSSVGLGLGHTALFLPVWLQKSFGPWMSYVGGGYWFNKTAAGDKDYWQTGWELQRDLSKVLTLGAEIFSFSPKMDGGPNETGLNAGAMINLSEEHHILLSAGGDTNGPNTHFAYAAFQWTIGEVK
jgi:hypothetical protein